MRNLCKLVGVTYGEFQSWYNYGEIRICSSRIVDFETTLDGPPDPESPNVSTLLERIPQLNLEDEEGVLIIQLKPDDIEIDNYKISKIDVQTIYLPIECIQRVIPLTERACRILEPRVGSFGVKISPAYFHKQVGGKWFRLKLLKALRGGDVLVNARFRDGLKNIDETLRKAVEFGICELLYQDCSMEDLADKNTIWIAEAFKYSRREPFKLGDLDYMIDAGAVLNEAFKSGDEEKSPRLKPFKDVLENAIDKRASLVEVFKDTKWIQDINKMERDLLGTTSVGLASLVLFLRWKEQFHKLNQEVDFDQLKEDTAEFAVSISFEQTVAAVWMFGCFVGYENVTQEVYTDEKYSFSSLTEPRFTEKISKPEKTNEVEKELIEGEKKETKTDVHIEAEETEADTPIEDEADTPIEAEEAEAVEKKANVAATVKSASSDKKTDDAPGVKEEDDFIKQGNQSSSATNNYKKIRAELGPKHTTTNVEKSFNAGDELKEADNEETEENKVETDSAGEEKTSVSAKVASTKKPKQTRKDKKRDIKKRKKGTYEQKEFAGLEDTK